MKFKKFRMKWEEGVEEGVNVVERGGEEGMEGEDLMGGLVKVGENVRKLILEKVGIKGEEIERVVEREIG